MRDAIVKQLVDILSDEDVLLITSSDDYFLSHYKNSPLEIITGFSGSTGEAIIDNTGKITLFVDPRYHLQAHNETEKYNIEVIELEISQSISSAIADYIGNKKILLPETSSLCLFKTFEKKVLTGTYKDTSGLENKTLDKSKDVFETQSVLSFKDKIKKISKSVKTRYMLVSAPVDISYLTNLRCYQMPYSSSIVAKLLIDFKGESILFIDDKIDTTDFRVLPISDFEKVVSSIEDKISIDENKIVLSAYNIIKKPVIVKKNPILELASIKDEIEIAHYKKAFKSLDKALIAFEKRIEEGLSELELKNILEEEIIKNGAQSLSFKTILSINENCASIHYTNYDPEKKLKMGDTILLDCGGYYEMGLATDITRVFYFGHNPTPLQKQVYTSVLKAFLNCYHLNKNSGNALDKKARELLKNWDKKGFKFPHALGHGIGQNVHQGPPYISSNLKFKSELKKAMVHTIEPGLYGKGEDEMFGVRLENTVIVTGKNKRESLSHFKFEEKLIDRNLLTKKESQWLDSWQMDYKMAYGETYER